MSGEQGRVSGRREHVIPAAIRSLDPMSSHYVDLFSISVSRADEASPEQWARAAMEGSPALGRFLAWRVLCGLRLATEPDGTPGFVAGWKIVDGSEDWIRMEAAAPHMTANIVFRVEPDRVWFATFLRYHNLLGRLVWTPVSAVHRRVAPDFLRGAARRVALRRAM